VADPFTYHHLGSLAYIGNAAVFDFGEYSFMGGLVRDFVVIDLTENAEVVMIGCDVCVEKYLLE
jgi:NADH dehydrogenase